MEKELPVGKEGKLDIKVGGGKIILEAKYDGAQVDAALVISADSDVLMDAIAAKIPGTVDDAVISVIKVALKAI